MEWVRENIASFGGNPQKITIDDCSAGAGSTANHIVNKKSWPFFDQAAGESGVGAQWNVNIMQQSQLFFDTLVLDANCSDVGWPFRLRSGESCNADRQRLRRILCEQRVALHTYRGRR